jgi:hypothetical protein
MPQYVFLLLGPFLHPAMDLLFLTLLAALLGGFLCFVRLVSTFLALRFFSFRILKRRKNGDGN